MSAKDFIGGFNITVEQERQELTNMINDLLEIEIKFNKMNEENIELKETIKDLREEGEEYDKKLNRIDELALLIENATEKIRNNI